MSGGKKNSPRNKCSQNLDSHVTLYYTFSMAGTEASNNSPRKVGHLEDEVTRIRNAFKRLPEPMQDALRQTGQRFPLIRRAAFGFLPILQDTSAQQK